MRHDVVQREPDLLGPEPIRPWNYIKMRRRAAGLTIEQAAKPFYQRPDHRACCEANLRTFEMPQVRVKDVRALDLPRAFPFDAGIYEMLRDLPQDEHPTLQRFRQSFAVHEEELLALPAIRTNRIAKTHGQLLAMLDALRVVMPKLREDQHRLATQLIHTMALERQLAVENEHPDVATFWERFDALEESEGNLCDKPINLHRDHTTMIAVSLGEFETRCADRNWKIPAHADLLKNLRTSKSRPFIDVKNVNTRPDGKVRHCWVFERPAATRKAGQ